MEKEGESFDRRSSDGDEKESVRPPPRPRGGGPRRVGGGRLPAPETISETLGATPAKTHPQLDGGADHDGGEQHRVGRGKENDGTWEAERCCPRVSRPTWQMKFRNGEEKRDFVWRLRNSIGRAVRYGQFGR